MMISDAPQPGTSTARPFWPDMPAGMRPSGGAPTSWPDDSGGWIVTGTERFSDQLVHQSVWRLDALGNAHRLGCNPSSASGFNSALALTPDAVYLASGVESDVSSYFDYSIVKLAR